jgi:hypothetical protein
MWNIAFSDMKGKLFKNSNILWSQNNIFQFWLLNLDLKKKKKQRGKKKKKLKALKESFAMKSFIT